MGTVQLRKGLLNRREKVFGRLVGPAYPPLQITHPGPNTQELRKSLRSTAPQVTSRQGHPKPNLTRSLYYPSCYKYDPFDRS